MSKIRVKVDGLGEDGQTVSTVRFYKVRSILVRRVSAKDQTKIKRPKAVTFGRFTLRAVCIGRRAE